MLFLSQVLGQKMPEQHRKFAGMTRTRAETEYLKLAQVPASPCLAAMLPSMSIPHFPGSPFRPLTPSLLPCRSCKSTESSSIR